MQVDLLHAGNLAGLDETTELGDGLPFLLLFLGTTTAATAAATTVTTARAKSSASTRSVSHFVLCRGQKVTGGGVVDVDVAVLAIHALVSELDFAGVR